MRLPWKKKTERRESYTDLLTAGLVTRISGASADVLVTGAAEMAAGIWGRTLAAARVNGTNALAPRIRHQIGRQLIRQGEAVYLIDVVREDAAVSLTHVADWDVLEGYRYQLTTHEPPGDARVRNVPKDAVIHLKWSEHPREPWRGVGPLVNATGLAELAAETEKKITEDMATPIAHIIPVPNDGGDANITALRGDIGNAKGGAVLTETTAGNWGEGTNLAPRSDWKAQRLGPEVPADVRLLYRDTMLGVLAACGIPGSIGGLGDADGTLLREDYRRFVMSHVEPVASMIAMEVSEGLGSEVSFDFAPLHAHDVQGRSSAMGNLVTAGMSLEEARRIVGL